MGVENNMEIQVLSPVSITTDIGEGDLQLSSETKKISTVNKFTGFMKNLYSKIVNSEAVRSFVSIFGHVALNVGETMALRKVKEVIKEKYPEKEAMYTAVAAEVLGRTSLVAKNSLPRASSIPEDLFKILCDSLTDFQIGALKYEQQIQREQMIKEALKEEI
jgi:hypothetical protein